MEEEKKKKSTKSRSKTLESTKGNASKKKVNTTKKSKSVEKTSPKKNEEKVIKESKGSSKSTLILSIIFFILLIVVIVLGFIVGTKREEVKKDVKANIVIPIVKTEDEFDFSINALALSKADSYIFKLTNYKGNSINKNEMKYTVTIENGTDSVIEVTKDGDPNNLMVDQEATIIEDVKLKKKDKDYSYYEVKMTSSGNLGKDEIINIKINSLK